MPAFRRCVAVCGRLHSALSGGDGVLAMRAGRRHHGLVCCPRRLSACGERAFIICPCPSVCRSSTTIGRVRPRAGLRLAGRLRMGAQPHAMVARSFEFAYASGAYQLVALPLLVALFGGREDVSEFFFCLAISSTLLLLISTCFPATSAFVHFAVQDKHARATISDFPGTRRHVANDRHRGSAGPRVDAVFFIRLWPCSLRIRFATAAGCFTRASC